MNPMSPHGVLGQLSTPRVKGRRPPDRSFYTYGQPPARGNSMGGPGGCPGPVPNRGANFASGGASGVPDGLPGVLRGGPGAAGPGGRGGMLQAPGGVHGPGTGRSDEIDAKLSDGEYVMDAESVSLLGDGSTEAGVKRLDELRKKIRSHKGKALARGKISPDAKRPEQYLGGK